MFVWFDSRDGRSDRVEKEKIGIRKRKVHALERIATVLENQQINQHFPPLSISPVIKFHWNRMFMWASWAQCSSELFWSKFVGCVVVIVVVVNFHIFIFFSRTTGSISTKLGTKHPWVKGIQIYFNEGSRSFFKGRW